MDNNKILEKVKMKIAISNAKKEDIVVKKGKISVFKGISAIAGIITLTTGIAFATTTIFKKFGENSSDGVQTAVDNGYYVEVNTEYKNSNGISASIESFLIDDNNFNMNIKIKFDEECKFDEILSGTGRIEIEDLQVINEKNEIVFATMQKEVADGNDLNQNKNYNSYKGAYSMYYEKISKNEIRYFITATGNAEKFPESKKLIVSFNKIKHIRFVYENPQDSNNKNSVKYEGEWKYEIDVPENMQKSNIVKYKVVSISDKNYKFEKAELSNTAFKLYLSNCDGINFSENECVETSNGNKYYPAYRSDGDGLISVTNDGIVTYYQTFNLTNYEATDNLKVHVFKTNGEEVIIELKKE